MKKHELYSQIIDAIIPKAAIAVIDQLCIANPTLRNFQDVYQLINTNTELSLCINNLCADNFALQPKRHQSPQISSRKVVYAVAKLLWWTLPTHHLNNLAEPTPFDICPCGSKRKAIHCCDQNRTIPNFSIDELIGLVANKLSYDALNFLAAHSNSIATHSAIAYQFSVDGHYTKALQIIEPYFNTLDSLPENQAHYIIHQALKCYTELNQDTKRKHFSNALLNSKNSTLQSCVLQAFALKSIQNKHWKTANKLIKLARRLTPNDANIITLEFLCLSSAHLYDHVKLRAPYWQAWFNKRPHIHCPIHSALPSIRKASEPAFFVLMNSIIRQLYQQHSWLSPFKLQSID